MTGTKAMSGDRPMQLAGRVTRLLCMSGQWMPTMVSSHPKLVSHETRVVVLYAILLTTSWG